LIEGGKGLGSCGTAFKDGVFGEDAFISGLMPGVRYLYSVSIGRLYECGVVYHSVDT